MVNRVLHEYIQAVRRKMPHVPLKVQQRLTHGLVARIEEDAKQLRTDHSDWSIEDATEHAIEDICPVEDLLPVHGPEEGIIRRSTAEWILHGEPPDPAPEGPRGKRWGAAAAALAGFAIFAAIAALALTEPIEDDLAGEALAAGTLVHEWRFEAAGGNHSQVLAIPDVAGAAFSIAGAGCVSVDIVDAAGASYVSGACIDAPWPIEDLALGDAIVTLRLTDFTGIVQLHAA